MSHLVIFVSSTGNNHTNIVNPEYPYLPKADAIAKAIRLQHSPNNWYINPMEQEVYRGTYHAVEMKIVYSTIDHVNHE